MTTLSMLHCMLTSSSLCNKHAYDRNVTSGALTSVRERQSTSMIQVMHDLQRNYKEQKLLTLHLNARKRQ